MSLAACRPASIVAAGVVRTWGRRRRSKQTLAGPCLSTLLVEIIVLSTICLEGSGREVDVSIARTPSQIHLSPLPVTTTAGVDVSWASEVPCTSAVSIAALGSRKPSWRTIFPTDGSAPQRYVYRVASSHGPDMLLRGRGQSASPVRNDHTESYQSPYLHRVSVPNLLLEQTYLYRCGCVGQWSPIFNFTTPAPADVSPTTLVVLADLGQTHFSRDTVRTIIRRDLHDADALLLAGDLSYADCSQTRWDAWADMMQPLVSRIPMITCPGNHEVEGWHGALCESPQQRIETRRFLAYRMRYSSALWGSYDVKLAHIVTLCSDCSLKSGSAQQNWLKKDLTKVNREKTPWLVVMIHVPMYHSNYAHQYGGERIRQQIEDLLLASGVDLVISGHVHAYERSLPVYKGRIYPAGSAPVYLVVGDSGNREGLASHFIDPAPSFSASRDGGNYGYGVLDIANATHALWQRRLSTEDVSEVVDKHWLVRSPSV